MGKRLEKNACNPKSSQFSFNVFLSTDVFEESNREKVACSSMCYLNGQGLSQHHGATTSDSGSQEFASIQLSGVHWNSSFTVVRGCRGDTTAGGFLWLFLGRRCRMNFSGDKARIAVKTAGRLGECTPV